MRYATPAVERDKLTESACAFVCTWLEEEHGGAVDAKPLCLLLRGQVSSDPAGGLKKWSSVHALTALARTLVGMLHLCFLPMSQG